MGALTIARPNLLAEQFELLANTGTSNGAGGRSSSAWTVQATTRGRRYTRATRNTPTEQTQGGKPSDPNVVEIVLDTMTVDGSWRVRAVKDATVYEILALSKQDGLTFVHARQVA